MRLLKDKEIKFSADRFLVNKWLSQKLMNISGSFRAKFVRHYEGYKNFKALRLNLNEQKASEKKTFFGVFLNFFERLLMVNGVIFFVILCGTVC